MTEKQNVTTIRNNSSQACSLTAVIMEKNI